MSDRESKLPQWVQSLLADLRSRLEKQNEPLMQELTFLRPKVELLKSKNEAMQELLECAAKGGHTTAVEIVKIIEGYDIQLIKKEPLP